MGTGILIADDEELVRTGFRMILEAEDDFEVLGEASSGTEAVEMARSLQPEVVLMDIRMPGMDGLEATKRIVESGSNKPELPISSCLGPSNAPSSTRAIVVSVTDAVNHPIKLTKPSLGVVS